jgi:hypothetical protein
MLASALAAAMLGEGDWRRTHVVFASLYALLIVGLIQRMTDLSLPQQIQLVVLLAGAIMLAVAHRSRFAESEDEPDSAVSFGLSFGALLVTAACGVGLIVHRLGYGGGAGAWGVYQEISALSFGLVLLFSGMLLQIRATTVGGGLIMLLYVLSLVAYVRWPQQLQHTAVYMMVGGAAVFAVGLLLSVYRDRLLQLPADIGRRRGVWRVLDWR